MAEEKTGNSGTTKYNQIKKYQYDQLIIKTIPKTHLRRKKKNVKIESNSQNHNK